MGRSLDDAMTMRAGARRRCFGGVVGGGCAEGLGRTVPLQVDLHDAHELRRPGVQTILPMHTVHARGEVEEARDVLLLTVGLKEKSRMCTSPPWSPARHLCRDPASRRSRLAGWMKEAWLPVRCWQQRRKRCRGAPGSCFAGSGWSSSSLRRLSLPARCCWDRRPARRWVAGWCRTASEQSIRVVQGRWRRAAYQGRCRSPGEQGRCRNAGEQRRCRSSGEQRRCRSSGDQGRCRSSGDQGRCRNSGEQGRRQAREVQELRRAGEVRELRRAGASAS